MAKSTTYSQTATRQISAADDMALVEEWIPTTPTVTATTVAGNETAPVAATAGIDTENRSWYGISVALGNPATSCRLRLFTWDGSGWTHGHQATWTINTTTHPAGFNLEIQCRTDSRIASVIDTMVGGGTVTKRERAI